MNLTNTNLKYLLTIYRLSADSSAVASADIAAALGVSRPSVTQMLAVLAGKDLVIKQPYGKVYLTARGRTLAAQHLERVGQISSFLQSEFGLTAHEGEAAAYRCLEVIECG